jgi:pre-mRNA-processing factor 40
MIEDSEQFKNDRDLQQVDRLAMLRIFEGYAQQILRTHEEQMRKSKLETMRRARKARDGFRALLSDMESQGKIGATTKWKEFLLLIEERDEYNAILGMPGSGPLELFQDVVDDIAEAISTSGEKVKSAVEKAGRHIELGWKPEQLQALLLELKISNLVPERHLELVNEYVSNVPDTHVNQLISYLFGSQMQTQLEKAAREERKRAERRKRHLMDDLRYAMKKAEPPINLDGPFEEVSWL